MKKKLSFGRSYNPQVLFSHHLPIILKNIANFFENVAYKSVAKCRFMSQSVAKVIFF